MDHGDLSGITLQQIRVFLTAAKHENFTKAAEEIIRAEARRMANTYAVNGGFICLPLIGNGQFVTPEEAVRMGWFMEEFRKTCCALGV